MIKCNVCKKEKKDEDFYIRENGIVRKECKQCISKKRKKEYIEKREQKIKKVMEYHYKNREAIKEKKRKYWINNREVLAEKNRQYCKEYSKTAKGRLIAKKATAKWSKKNKHKLRAHWAVQNAVKRGRIIKPKNCEKCGIEGVMSAHHYAGYDKDNYFKIKWLCSKCHKKEHYVKL